MSREGDFPLRGRARDVFKRLEEANLLDKIPDRIDPNSVFSEDEDSSFVENYSENCEPQLSGLAQDESLIQRSKSASNIQLSQEDRVEKYNKMYTEIVKKISNLNERSCTKTGTVFSTSKKIDFKIGNGNEFLSDTPQCTYPFKSSGQQSRDNSFTRTEVHEGRDDPRQSLFLGSIEKKKQKEENYDKSSKVLWRGPSFHKAHSSIKRVAMRSDLRNTPSDINPFISRLGKPDVHAPRKECSVKPLRFTFPENEPWKLRLQLDSSISNEGDIFTDAKSEHTAFKPNIKPEHVAFQRSVKSEHVAFKPNILLKESVIKTDVACSPIRHVSESDDEILLVNKREYCVLSLLGRGGSCKVFSAFDKESKRIVAIKIVDIAQADEVLKDGFLREMKYLVMLRDSNHVIKLIAYECQKDNLLLVMEKGDIDFAHFLSDAKKIKSLTPLMVKFYWSQMLKAVRDIHEHGIIHSDLKPANFLLVSGHLKLIDFGISASVPSDMTSAIRSSQVGTVNYMSPEAITVHSSNTEEPKYQFKVGVKADVWSLGCILYNLVYGHTPFQKIQHFAHKIIAITNSRHVIAFPYISDPMLMDVMKACLRRNPKERASVDELLNHPYLKMEDQYSWPGESEDNIDVLFTKISNFSPRRQSFVTNFVEKLVLEDK